MVGTFKSLFKQTVNPQFIHRHIQEQLAREKQQSPLANDQPDDGTRYYGDGPVSRIARGTFERRVTAWEPDPARPDTHLRAFHYTKGWRYRKDLSHLYVGV